MPIFPVQAQLESPVVLRRERQSQRSEGIDYIPGTQVRGAFARLYLWQKGEADQMFAKLFSENGGCRFGPLDPGNAYFPATAASCKRVPGFLKDGGHGVQDRLCDWITWSLTGRPPQPETGRCPRCGNDLKPLEGSYLRLEAENYAGAKGRWRRHMMAHVGIERLTGTAAESIFFHLPALEPNPQVEETDFSAGGNPEPPVLHGWIEAEEDLVAQLRSLLEKEDNILRIGHARTRGYGKIRISIGDPSPESCFDPEPLNRCLMKKLQGISDPQGTPLDPEQHLIFTLDFPCGGILLDDVLRYTLDPHYMAPWLPPLPGTPLAKLAGQAPAKSLGNGIIWCVAAVTRHERVRGWNAAQGLPRGDEWAVTRGSVYAYLFKGPAADREKLVQQLIVLQREGIGARRNEGFGKVVVSDPFHLQSASIAL
jgi:CRISPR-associated Csx10 family RAMP protein